MKSIRIYLVIFLKVVLLETWQFYQVPIRKDWNIDFKNVMKKWTHETH